MIHIQFREDENIPDLCLDALFKALMTQETPHSRGARDSFLSAIVEEPIKVLSATAEKAHIYGIHKRRIRFELNVSRENGEMAHVDITKDLTPYKEFRREPSPAQLRKEEELAWNDALRWDCKKTWFVSLLPHRKLFPDEEMIHRFAYYDKNNKILLSGIVEMITVELEKVEKAGERSAAEMSPQERWAYFLHYGGDKSKRCLINEILAADEGIAMAGQMVQGFMKHKWKAPFFRSNLEF
jgi:hypothetical protein